MDHHFPHIRGVHKIGAGSLRRGKLADARAGAERVVAIRRRAFPPGHFKIAEALRELAGVLHAEDKPAEALAQYEAALAITDDARPEQLVLIAGLHTSIAMVEQQLGHHARALEHFDRAVRLVRARSGDGSLELAILLLNYGQVRSIDDIDAAIATIGEGRAILERLHDLRAATAGVALAIVQAQARRWPDAARTAEAMLAQLASDADPEQIAETKWVLARALVETHGDRRRARALAGEARQLYVQVGPARASRIKEIDAWLAKSR